MILFLSIFHWNEVTNVILKLSINKAIVSNDIPITVLEQRVHVYDRKLTEIMNEC